MADRALFKSQKASRKDYCVQFSGTYDASACSIDPDECFDRDASGIPILKLHGSLNWLGAKSDELFTGDGQVLYLRDGADLSMGPDFFMNRFPLGLQHLCPLIVPPTFLKDIWRRGAILRIWQMARTSLQSCHRVVIVGHSLREADYQMRWLLRTALVANQETVEVAVVSNSAEDRARLCAFFGDLAKVFESDSVVRFLGGPP